MSNVKVISPRQRILTINVIFISKIDYECTVFLASEMNYYNLVETFTHGNEFAVSFIYAVNLVLI